MVQNILFGLSPSLTDGIRSLPRWRLAQAALPHVLHCCAALLCNRCVLYCCATGACCAAVQQVRAVLLCNRKDASISELGAAETKLLYTLHWLFLDAAEECADADADKAGQRKSARQYLYPVTSLQASVTRHAIASQVFVYLFAPLLRILRESDFQNFRLENGLKIWGALWEHRHPDVAVFTTPVSPQKVVLRPRRVKAVGPLVQQLPQPQQVFGDVFLGSGGAGPSKPQLPYGHDSEGENILLYSVGLHSVSSFSGSDSPLPDDIRLDDEVCLCQLLTIYFYLAIYF
ncbi:hypothetical protein HAZT_HAZT009566 [Hyalella azteca]|uniref:Cation channel complex component UNC80 N-terminal domain-containing protein n=1 Tax=Hyalella azteca TaxID=294128 RepID=A0A6A0H3X7_HYAAZ|nr:hypothetical protein HAZT_HAZT009566 [Hyalella azteca]